MLIFSLVIWEGLVHWLTTVVTCLVYKGEGKMLQTGIVIPEEEIFRDCSWHKIRALL